MTTKQLTELPFAKSAANIQYTGLTATYPATPYLTFNTPLKPRLPNSGLPIYRVCFYQHVPHRDGYMPRDLSAGQIPTDVVKQSSQ